VFDWQKKTRRFLFGVRSKGDDLIQCLILLFIFLVLFSKSCTGVLSTSFYPSKKTRQIVERRGGGAKIVLSSFSTTSNEIFVFNFSHHMIRFVDFDRIFYYSLSDFVSFSSLSDSSLLPLLDLLLSRVATAFLTE